MNDSTQVRFIWIPVATKSLESHIIVLVETQCVADKVGGERCKHSAQSGWMTCYRSPHRIQAPRRRSSFISSSRFRLSQSQEPHSTGSADPSKPATGSAIGSAGPLKPATGSAIGSAGPSKPATGSAMTEPVKDVVEEQVERSLNSQQRFPPFHNQKVPWHKPIGLLSRLPPQSDMSNAITAGFQDLQNQLDVWLQATASKD